MMANERLKFAIGRLDRATARVERLVAEHRPGAPSSEADKRLHEKHQQLRDQVRTAISRIDTLIASSG